jgi:hypothetical protein
MTTLVELCVERQQKFIKTNKCIKYVQHKDGSRNFEVYINKNKTIALVITYDAKLRIKKEEWLTLLNDSEDKIYLSIINCDYDIKYFYKLHNLEFPHKYECDEKSDTEFYRKIIKIYISDEKYPSCVEYSYDDSFYLPHIEKALFYKNNRIVDCKSETGAVTKTSNGFVVDFTNNKDNTCYL